MLMVPSFRSEIPTAYTDVGGRGGPSIKGASSAADSRTSSASISRSTSPIRRSSGALRKRSRFSAGVFPHVPAPVGSVRTQAPNLGEAEYFLDHLEATVGLIVDMAEIVVELGDFRPGDPRDRKLAERGKDAVRRRRCAW